jgi:hypothetical protein
MHLQYVKGFHATFRVNILGLHYFYNTYFPSITKISLFNLKWNINTLIFNILFIFKELKVLLVVALL